MSSEAKDAERKHKAKLPFPERFFFSLGGMLALLPAAVWERSVFVKVAFAPVLRAAKIELRMIMVIFYKNASTSLQPEV